MNNIETWAARNNLALNRKKSKEIIFIDPRRKYQFVVPSSLPDIVRDTSVKILAVSITDSLSASDHVRGVISSSAQTLYALRVLRAHGMNDMALQAWVDEMNSFDFVRLSARLFVAAHVSMLFISVDR